MYRIATAVFLIAVIFMANLHGIEENGSPGGKKLNVIMMIGDGMGITQIAAAHYRRHGTSGDLLKMETMPVTGVMYTFSKDHLVPDSASAGTALATGISTNNGMIGMTSDGTKMKSILQFCKESGMNTGLIVTSPVAHATPAAYVAHVKARTLYHDIASDLLRTRPDLVFGGGREDFLPLSAKGTRKDGRNLLIEAAGEGYHVISDKKGMDDAEGLPIIGLFQAGSLKTSPGSEPTLQEMTEKGIGLLNQPDKGFFLMIEGSRIDWGCHDNDLDDAVRQTLLFDDAVGSALDFARKDGNTLVIVTADHETGGLAINWGSPRGKGIQAAWTTKGHTADPVIVFAFGPGQEGFSGVFENHKLAKKIAGILKIENFPGKLSD